MNDFVYSDLIGKPFEYGGRGPDVFDCYGLVKFALQRAGVDIPDYPSNKLGVMNSLTILSAMSQFQKCAPEVGAIALFRMDYMAPSHVGLVVENDSFIHIMESINVAKERLSSPLWRKRVVGFYRWQQ